MNITVARSVIPRQNEGLVTFGIVLLARKLQALATGIYPQQPLSLFLTQAQSIAYMPEVTHSVLASIEEVVRLGEAR